jgi:hypothetical protein
MFLIFGRFRHYEFSVTTQLLVLLSGRAALRRPNEIGQNRGIIQSWRAGFLVLAYLSGKDSTSTCLPVMSIGIGLVLALARIAAVSQGLTG